MIREEEETPNPLNFNDEVLEEGKFIPKQPTTNVPKRDPIWEFFNLDEGTLICSKMSQKWWIITLDDTELRHALANMVAVVFGIPDKSTHLRYHMFSPKDLENSYMTGFMVCLL